jgi:hypothetical protein
MGKNEWKSIFRNVGIVIGLGLLVFMFGFTQSRTRELNATSLCSEILSDIDVQGTFPDQFSPLEVSGYFHPNDHVDIRDLHCSFIADSRSSPQDGIFNITTDYCNDPVEIMYDVEENMLPTWGGEPVGPERYSECVGVEDKIEGVRDLHILPSVDRGGEWDKIGEFDSIDVERSRNDDENTGESIYTQSIIFFIEGKNVGIDGAIFTHREPRSIQAFLNSLTRRSEVIYESIDN